MDSNSLSWSPVTAQRLFNLLQNLNCTVVIDTRELFDYNVSHLRHSFHITADSLISRVEKGSILNVVCVSNDGFSSAVSFSSLDRLLCQYTDDLYEGSKKLKCLSYLDCSYNSFETNYRMCGSLFVKSGQSKTPKMMCYPNEIIPNFLFLGNARQSSDIDVLNHLSITHLVDASGNQVSHQAAESLGISYIHIDIEDTPNVNIAQYFHEVNSFISAAHSGHTDKSEKILNREALPSRVLVHCQAGVSRGCSFVLAYLMHSHVAMSYKQALDMVLAERPWVCPNISFREQLRTFESSVYPSQSPSFESDIENKQHIMDVFEWNSGGFHATVYDDTPITAGRHGLRFSKDITPEELQVLENELMASCTPSTNTSVEDQTSILSRSMSCVAGVPSCVPAVSTSTSRTRKPFLKRGQGRTAVPVGIKKKQSSCNSSSTTHTADNNNIPTDTSA